MQTSYCPFGSPAYVTIINYSFLWQHGVMKCHTNLHKNFFFNVFRPMKALFAVGMSCWTGNCILTKSPTLRKSVNYTHRETGVIKWLTLLFCLKLALELALAASLIACVERETESRKSFCSVVLQNFHFPLALHWSIVNCQAFSLSLSFPPGVLQLATVLQLVSPLMLTYCRTVKSSTCKLLSDQISTVLSVCIIKCNCITVPAWRL